MNDDKLTLGSAPAMTEKRSKTAGRVERHDPPSMKSVVISIVAIAVALVWGYWTTLAQLAAKWGSDPSYSHGYLVPLFAVGLLWMRKSELDTTKIGTNWWGLVLLIAGVALRIAGVHYYFDWFDAVSLIPVIAGICLLLGGSTFLVWTLPAIAFLFFMIPLPFQAEIALQTPLRRIGTVASVYIMQTIGLPALAEGNIIVIGETRLGVAEACSGLRMLMIFFALTTAVALVSQRPLWERILIVVSAVPIALATNIIRIAVTGCLYSMNYSELADRVFHDWAGWLMMPFALVLLWFEFWILSKVVITEDDDPVSVLMDAGHATT